MWREATGSSQGWINTIYHLLLGVIILGVVEWWDPVLRSTLLLKR